MSRESKVLTLDKPGMRRRLLKWYQRAKRDLPWRSTSDSYRIWLSEVMLQQTRVEAVKPYYDNFLRKFPSIRALAASREDQVLAAWSGLGYYSRARNLQKTAKLIVHEHRGKFPKDEASALALPGVGRYTAAAVLSIAYGVPLAVLDGNVARVLSRLLAVPADVRESRGQTILWTHAQDLLDSRKPGEFNQAMMELGATVCLPGMPKCGACPLNTDCEARRRGIEDQFPPARKREQETSLELVGAIVRDKAGRYLLERRKKSATWMAGFWQIPTWQLVKGPDAPLSHESSLIEDLSVGHSLGSLRHSITKFRIRIDVRRAELADAREFRLTGGNVLWATGTELSRIPVTTITRKAILLEQAKGE